MYVSALFVNNERTMGPADTHSHLTPLGCGSSQSGGRDDQLLVPIHLPSPHSVPDRHPSGVIIVYYGWLTYALAFASDYISPRLLKPLYLNTPLRMKFGRWARLLKMQKSQEEALRKVDLSFSPIVVMCYFLSFPDRE